MTYTTATESVVCRLENSNKNVDKNQLKSCIREVLPSYISLRRVVYDTPPRPHQPYISFTLEFRSRLIDEQTLDAIKNNIQSTFDISVKTMLKK